MHLALAAHMHLAPAGHMQLAVEVRTRPPATTGRLPSSLLRPAST